MAVDRTLQVGAVEALTNSHIYGLPQRQVLIFTDATTPVIAHSTDPAFGTSANITLTAGQGLVGGGWIKPTSGDMNVVLAYA